MGHPGLDSVEDKVREPKYRKFGYVQRKDAGYITKRTLEMKL